MSTRFNPDIIKSAPIDVSEPERDSAEQELVELRHAKTVLEDENDRLKKEISVESQKARLIVPYANKVFWFCCTYTIISFCILFLNGYESIRFNLDEATLHFIAGTNLASVIGLLAIIAGGLFNSK